jgi:hypothetical protein
MTAKTAHRPLQAIAEQIAKKARNGYCTALVDPAGKVFIVPAAVEPIGTYTTGIKRQHIVDDLAEAGARR